MYILDGAKRLPSGTVVVKGIVFKARKYGPKTNPNRRMRKLTQTKRHPAALRRAEEAAREVRIGDESGDMEQNVDVDHDYNDCDSDWRRPSSDEVQMTREQIFQEIWDLVSGEAPADLSTLMEEAPEKADEDDNLVEDEAGLFLGEVGDSVGLGDSNAPSVRHLVAKYSIRYIHAAPGTRKRKATVDGDEIEEEEGEKNSLDDPLAVQVAFDCQLGPWAIKSAVSSTYHTFFEHKLQIER